MAWRVVMVAAMVLVLAVLLKDHFTLYSAPPDKPPSPTPPPPTQQSQDVGEPLFLTPLIEAGKIEEGRKLSRVSVGEEYALSYSGFFTVNKTADSHHFVWFFPAKKNWEDAPVVVWQEAGPGLSSMLSLFSMHGPFSLTRDLELVPRERTLTKYFNIIYMDSPVHAGYSYTSDDRFIPRYQEEVAIEVYSTVTQLLQMFPEIKNNNLFVAGQSYAGKFVATLGHIIQAKNRNTQHKIQLKGIAIGNGKIDPESLIHFGDMLHVLGIIDEKDRQYFEVQSELALSLVKRGDLHMAHRVVSSLMGTDLGSSYYNQVSGLHNHLNFMADSISEVLHYMDPFAIQPHVRRALHVGNKTYNPVHYLGKFFTFDVMKTSKPYVEELLNDNITVLLYNGQLDLAIPYVSTDLLMRSLNWDHLEEYLEASRKVWRVEGKLAGYVREAHGLVHVLVRCASHTVGLNQPDWMFDMFTRFMTQDIFL